MSKQRIPGSTLSRDPDKVRKFNKRGRRHLRPVRVERDWSDARRKVEREGGCRLCGGGPVEAAHIIGRDRDRPRDLDPELRLSVLETLLADGEIQAAVELARKGPDPGAVLYVHPDAVLALDRACHDRYDGQAPGRPRIDVLSVLTLDEQIRAVADAGGVELMRMRTAPSAYER